MYAHVVWSHLWYLYSLLRCRFFRRFLHENQFRMQLLPIPNFILIFREKLIAVRPYIVSNHPCTYKRCVIDLFVLSSPLSRKPSFWCFLFCNVDSGFIARQNHIGLNVLSPWKIPRLTRISHVFTISYFPDVHNYRMDFIEFQHLLKPRVRYRVIRLLVIYGSGRDVSSSLIRLFHDYLIDDQLFLTPFRAACTAVLLFC